MHPNCVADVQSAAKALGRQALSNGQLKAIDDRLSATMRHLARTDPNWRALTLDQRMVAASQQAMQDVLAEAARKVQNAQLQVLKTAATDQRVNDAQAVHGGSRSAALVRDIENTGAYISGIKQEAVGGLMDLMDAVNTTTGTSPLRRISMFLFDADNPQMTRDVAAEIYRNADGHTGNKVAQEGAKAYLDTIEGMRQRFNAAGGDVGKLDYGYIPQPHDAARVRGAGVTAWVDKTLPQLDRSRYVLEDGSRMSDAEVRAFLASAYDTIATEGLNKTAPGQFRGSGAKANAGSESRQIHFKDADAYLAYMQDFGTGSMYDAVIGHVGRLARDIGLVERYGPNPNAQMRLQIDVAERAGGSERSFMLRPESYWDQISGAAGAARSARLAQLGTDARNIQTFGKLGSAVISSITDLGTYFVTTGYNKLGYWNAVKNITKTATSKDARDFMTAHGIIAESMIGDLNRWTGDNIRQNWSGRLANSTLKLSLMNAWTDTLRRSFSLTMMQGMARMSKTDWGNLSEWDRALMERKGITDADWAVIRTAQLTDFNGVEHLTPEAIRAGGDPNANEVVAKVLGLIQDESEYAVLNPDLATKTLASGGGKQRGTVTGELARSVMQFKSFPIAMISRHWRRALEAPKVADGSAPAMANRVMYAGALMLTTTALGAIATQGKQIISGKDPIDMTGDHAAKFWTKSLAQGGGLSIAGDMLLNDPNDSPGGFARSFAGTLFGPTVSTVGEGLGVALEEGYRAADGKDSHFGARMLRLAKSNTPYTSLWYARAALDHAGLNALQENLSPGYLAKMRARSQKEWGQDYWWKPGTGLPERAPNVGKAVGQ